MASSVTAKKVLEYRPRTSSPPTPSSVVTPSSSSTSGVTFSRRFTSAPTLHDAAQPSNVSRNCLKRSAPTTAWRTTASTAWLATHRTRTFCSAASTTPSIRTASSQSTSWKTFRPISRSSMIPFLSVQTGSIFLLLTRAVWYLSSKNM